MTPTTLWTNQNQTANFAAQNVNLSDSISNYKYIKITFKNQPTGTVISNVIYETSVIMASVDASNTPFCSINCTSPSNYSWVRQIYYTNATRLWIATATRFNENTDDICIPLEIIGLN